MLAAPVTLALALAVATSPALGAYVGFNYGSTFTNGAIKAQADFEAEFKAAQALVTAPQTFSSARLYTMVQGGTANSVISAIPAAIATKTSLLLGIWASAGDANFANEIAALKSAIATYGADVGSSLDIAGISVGSEDLYRISPTGIENGENPGAQPATLVNYIGQVKAAIAGTPFSAIPVGHVDTWTAWVNASNSAVAAASDFVGVDAYPYFEDTVSNSISDGRSLFNSALDQTKAAVGGKPVWITETGWPVSGPTRNLAVPSPGNAKQYWDEVGCPLFGATNTWWFTFQDAAPDTPSPSFGLISSTLGSNPLYDLSCNASPSSSSTGTSATPATSVVATVTTVTGNGTTSTNLTTQTMTSHVASPSQPSSSSGTGSNGTFTSSVAAPTTTVVTTSNGAVHFVSVAAVFAAILASLLVL